MAAVIFAYEILSAQQIYAYSAGFEKSRQNFLIFKVAQVFWSTFFAIPYLEIVHRHWFSLYSTDFKCNQVQFSLHLIEAKERLSNGLICVKTLSFEI